MEATTQGAVQAEEAVSLAVETLRGDIRDQILDDIARPMPDWVKLSEREQKRVIDKADRIAYETLREVVKLVAHQGFPHLVVSTGKWTVKDGIKLEVGASSSVDDITKLAEHGARSAVLVLAEPSLFFGQRADAVADKDEPELPIHDEDGVILGADISPEDAETMIATAASLKGMTINLTGFTPERREAVTQQILAKGGKILIEAEVEPEAAAEADAEAEAEADPSAEAGEAPAATKRRRRSTTDERVAKRKAAVEGSDMPQTEMPELADA